jgi:hypothetical protein
MRGKTLVPVAQKTGSFLKLHISNASVTKYELNFSYRYVIPWRKLVRTIVVFIRELLFSNLDGVRCLYSLIFLLFSLQLNPGFIPE